MEVGKGKKRWERTNVTNLLRYGQSGTYYARVKVNGKEKWRSLKTKVFSVAKLKVGDVEKDERSKGIVAASESLPEGGETTVQRFIVYRALLDSILRRGAPKSYHYGGRYWRVIHELSGRIDDWKGLEPHLANRERIGQEHARKTAFWRAVKLEQWPPARK
jgi:hypothetical protein